MRRGNPTPAQRVKSAIAVLISIAVLAGGAAFVGVKGYEWYQEFTQRDDYVGNGQDPIIIVIPRGAGWTRVGDILAARDVIASSDTFLEELEKKQSLTTEELVVQAGRYEMMTRWPAATALNYLLDPSHRIISRATIPEGYRWADQIMPILVEATDLTELDFQAAAADTASLGLPAYANGQIEGYLFPDTYELPELATEILQMLVGEFKTNAEELGLEARAAELGVSPHDIVVIASIIEGEVFRDEDRPKVARAIYNRLAQGMPLGVESAFRYGRLLATGTPYDDPIMYADQQDASLPYNYYQNPGLPASAISNPGEAALYAALNPAEGDWIYWTTVNLDTGETGFAATEEEFNELVAQFNAWCAENGNPAGCQ